MENSNRTMITVRLPNELIERLRVIAKSDMRSVNKTVELATMRYVEARESTKEAQE